MKQQIAFLLFACALSACTHGPRQGSSAPVEISTKDVDLFYKVYDAAGGAPTADALQRDYIDAGSQGVREFVPHRIVSGEALAARIARDRTVYDRARSCASALPGSRERLAAAFRRLTRLYPEARLPPVTILIGRDNSGGTAGDSGVLVGLEVVCRPGAPDPDIEDRLVHLIAHEYGHVQQAPNPPGVVNTLLRQSLREGVAELLGELISGRISNIHIAQWTKGRELEFETQFLAESGGTDFSKWIYNGVGTPEKPGDLGYWIGYRIARSYYDRARDKRAALRELLELKDPQAILRNSGWRPGIQL